MLPRPRHATKGKTRSIGGLTSRWNGEIVWMRWGDRRGGRDESKRHRAESQWIVAARPLCHLQYPIMYLSRLQRILLAARWELYFMVAHAARPPRGLGQRHVPFGARGPLLQVGNRATGACVTSSPDSDLKAPTRGQDQEGLPLCITEYFQLFPPKERLGKNPLWHEETLDLLRRNNGSFLEQFLESCPDFLHKC